MISFHNVRILIFLYCLLLGTYSFGNAAEKNVLMVLWRGHTLYEESFLKNMQDRKASVEFTVLDAKQNQMNLSKEIRAVRDKLKQGDYDAIYAFGTSVTSFLAAVDESDTPVVFTVVFDPVGAGIVSSLEKTDSRFTGVSNGVRVSSQLRRLHGVVPFKKLVFIFSGREKNATLQSKAVRKWAEEEAIELEIFRVAPKTPALDDVLKRIESGELDCDAVYAGADSYMVSQAAYIASRIGNRVPLFGGSEIFVRNGWLGAYSVPVETVGQKTAALMMQVLNDVSPSSLPVESPKPVLFLSRSGAKRFSVKAPDDTSLLP